MSDVCTLHIATAQWYCGTGTVGRFWPARESCIVHRVWAVSVRNVVERDDNLFRKIVGKAPTKTH